VKRLRRPSPRNRQKVGRIRVEGLYPPGVCSGELGVTDPEGNMP
jgi:hypothetical protein